MRLLESSRLSVFFPRSMVRKASDPQVIDLLLETPFSGQLHGFVCSISMHIFVVDKYESH